MVGVWWQMADPYSMGYSRVAVNGMAGMVPNTALGMGYGAGHGAFGPVGYAPGPVVGAGLAGVNPYLGMGTAVVRPSVVGAGVVGVNPTFAGADGRLYASPVGAVSSASLGAFSSRASYFSVVRNGRCNATGMCNARWPLFQA